ncbi:MAG: cytochrome b/b6 domain-containing protein [Sandarakinorhabdus sp.]|nr:cytochrome b/b6 domain-containing protein [Sandarakinorhabdus sp.]
MTAPVSPDDTSLSRKGEAGRPVKVWDPLVRVLHWTMALGVIANLTLLRENDGLHNIVGYVVGGALTVRVLWGFVGTRHARFVDFVPRPTPLLGYLKSMLARREPRYIGHNPAGSVMIVGLLLLLAVLGLSGWMMGLDRFWGVAWVESLHETAANIVTAAAVLHVLAAIFESLRHRENLPWSMITGYKRAASGTDIDHAPPAR